MTAPFSVWWPCGDDTFEDEDAFAVRFCREHSRRTVARWHPNAQWIPYNPLGPLGIVLEKTSSPQVLWVTDPSLLLNSAALHLLAAPHDRASLCAPTYLDSVQPNQKATLPFPYHDVPTYEEAAHHLGLDMSKIPFPVPKVDPRCFSVSLARIRAAFLRPWSVCSKDAAALLAAHGGMVEPRAFVHVFFPLDEQPREDLLALIPEHAAKILDVGCSSGLFGIALKAQRPEVFLTGVEPDKRKAHAARVFYDVLYEGHFEAVALSGPFDVIVCGDVLEHLQDPWAALRKIHALLASDGYLVLSVPNVGHWTVVRGLLQGTFEYVPAGILNRGHLRFFTEDSLRRALEQSGFVVEVFQRRQPPPPPQGRRFLDQLRCLESVGVSEQSLLTEAFLVRARKASNEGPKT
ncbi:class I SAM-dependent methyltransferase [Desulfosoma sp.]